MTKKSYVWCMDVSPIAWWIRKGSWTGSIIVVMYKNTTVVFEFWWWLARKSQWILLPIVVDCEPRMSPIKWHACYIRWKSPIMFIDGCRFRKRFNHLYSYIASMCEITRRWNVLGTLPYTETIARSVTEINGSVCIVLVVNCCVLRSDKDGLAMDGFIVLYLL